MAKSKKITIGNFNQIIIRNLVIILVLTIIGALSAGLYARHKRITFFSAESSVILNVKVTHTDYKNAAMMAEKGMMHSYEEILNNRETMKKAERYLPANLRKNYSYEWLASVVNVNSSPDSLVLRITAGTTQENISVKIANAVARAAQTQLPQYSPNDSRVKILTRATRDNVSAKTTPSVKKYVVLGAALGLLVGMIFSFSITTWKSI